MAGPPPKAPVGPRALERPADRGHTLVHSLDSDTPAKVDGAGGVQLAGHPWMIDWWIGGDDRWYFPSKEPAVRQRRIGGGPVLETSARIPSGDVLLRTYAVNSGGNEALVLEFENDSPIPVALAFAVRPFDIEGNRSSVACDLNGDRLSIGGVPMVGLPRDPNEYRVEDDGSAVCMYPLPHRTTLRFVVGAGAPSPQAMPDAETVANGWNTIIERGGRFVLPDNGLTQQVDAARARLLGAASNLPDQVAALEPGAGRILEGLALSGSVDEVFGSLGAFAGTFPTKLPGDPADAAAIIAGLGRSARLADDKAVAEALLEPAAQLTSLVERAAKKSRNRDVLGEAFSGLARLLFTVGQLDAAAELIKRGAKIERPDIASSLAELSTLAESASAARSWGDDDPVAAARFWIGTRQLLLEGRLDSLDLLPSFPAAWRGGNLEVHQAQTGHGVISFGIRWHGYRPALLWDLESETSSTLRCPGLDPAWTTTEPKGDALLAGTPEELPDAPAAGESFQ